MLPRKSAGLSNWDSTFKYLASYSVNENDIVTVLHMAHVWKKSLVTEVNNMVLTIRRSSQVILFWTSLINSATSLTGTSMIPLPIQLCHVVHEKQFNCTHYYTALTNKNWFQYPYHVYGEPIWSFFLNTMMSYLLWLYLYRHMYSQTTVLEYSWWTG